MADEFPIPETQVLAVASHVGATCQTTLIIQLTDITQGCLRVSSAALGLAMPPTKKHAWQDMSGTPWRRT